MITISISIVEILISSIIGYPVEIFANYYYYY